MSSKQQTLLAVGDVYLYGAPPAEPLFEKTKPVLEPADITLGHVKCMFTSRGVNTFADMGLAQVGERFEIPGADPRNIAAIKYAGFDVMALANCHCWDAGDPGIEDTVAGLEQYNIAHCGVGMNIDEARRPAIVERDGVRYGFLSYNCTGPKGSWALPQKAGCAYLHILAAYEMDLPIIGGYPTTYTFAEPGKLKAMEEDIRKLRPLCDVLVVFFSKGIGFLPVKLAMYEQQVSYAAIDAGADLILASHAHILKGIEQYKGKWIFHGLGNFVISTEESTVQGESQDRKFVKAHGGPFFFEPGGKETSFPYSPEQELTVVAKCTVEDGQIVRAGYLPCIAGDNSAPEIIKNDERGRRVFEYMENITRGAELNARFAWEGDEVMLYT
ncbi:MAG: CapA family protein [Dehalococcoidales bacterium]|nr:CapA family protein [Dehalococcoidales bacterium]